MARLGSLQSTSVDPESLAFRRGSFKLNTFWGIGAELTLTNTRAPRPRKRSISSIDPDGWVAVAVPMRIQQTPITESHS